jgi:hypothetical protein
MHSLQKKCKQCLITIGQLVGPWQIVQANSFLIWSIWSDAKGSDSSLLKICGVIYLSVWDILWVISATKLLCICSSMSSIVSQLASFYINCGSWVLLVKNCWWDAAKKDRIRLNDANCETIDDMDEQMHNNFVAEMTHKISQTER